MPSLVLEADLKNRKLPLKIFSTYKISYFFKNQNFKHSQRLHKPFIYLREPKLKKTSLPHFLFRNFQQTNGVKYPLLSEGAGTIMK